MHCTLIEYYISNNSPNLSFLLIIMGVPCLNSLLFCIKDGEIFSFFLFTLIDKLNNLLWLSVTARELHTVKTIDELIFLGHVYSVETLTLCCLQCKLVDRYFNIIFQTSKRHLHLTMALTILVVFRRTLISQNLAFEVEL